jgi:hypothetical protein
MPVILSIAKNYLLSDSEKSYTLIKSPLSIRYLSILQDSSMFRMTNY